LPEVLGRVTTRNLEIPRGPDVTHRIRVRREWLDNGDVVEFELPRNLTCAACDGGGCDACDRSGAITLRGRDELPEIIQVTLPRRSEEKTEGRLITIRIPEQGGLPAEGSGLPRGLLLLRVQSAEQPDAEVRLVGPPSLPVQISAAIQEKIASVIPPRSGWLLAVGGVVIVLALGALFWAAYR
jgi:hypothetical protein